MSGFVPASDVRNPHDLELSLQLNQNYVQRENTRNMLFKIPDLIEYVSSYVTLHEGDMIITGTPKGAGRVKAGDYLYASLKQGKTELASMFMKIDKEVK